MPGRFRIDPGKWAYWTISLLKLLQICYKMFAVCIISVIFLADLYSKRLRVRWVFFYINHINCSVSFEHLLNTGMKVSLTLNVYAIMSDQNKLIFKRIASFVCERFVCFLL